MMSYQEMKRLKEWKNDVELALHRGSAVSGDSSTAPQFAGLLNKLSTNFTSSSGTTLTERVYNDLVTLAFANPVNIRETYCNMQAKRSIDGFTTNTTRFLPTDDRRALNIVDVYFSYLWICTFLRRRKLKNGLNSGNPLAIMAEAILN